MCLQRVIWLNLHGNSHTPVAFNPTQAKQFANQLRAAADWVDSQGMAYLQK